VSQEGERKGVFSSWLTENGREGRGRKGIRADYEMDGTVHTCRLHQSCSALLPVAVLHHLEEKRVRVGDCCEGGFERDQAETVGNLVFDRLAHGWPGCSLVNNTPGAVSYNARRK
jgi:hypothetical protein